MAAGRSRPAGVNRPPVRPRSTLTSHRTRPAASACACNAVSTACHVPSRCRRRNNQYDVCHGAYSAGTSRHDAPTRIRHRIPSINCRLLHFSGRPLTDAAGSTAARTAHRASLRSCRLATTTLATRSPVFRFAWSLTHLPETSPHIDHRHADERPTLLTSGAEVGRPSLIDWRHLDQPRFDQSWRTPRSATTSAGATNAQTEIRIRHRLQGPPSGLPVQGCLTRH